MMNSGSYGSGTITTTSSEALQAAVEQSEIALKSARAARRAAKVLVRVCKQARSAAREALANAALANTWWITNPGSTTWIPSPGGGVAPIQQYQGQAKITYAPYSPGYAVINASVAATVLH